MIYNIIRFIFAIFSYILMGITGWSIKGAENVRTNKLSVGMYCHTSCWDCIIGLMVTCILRFQLLPYNISILYYQCNTKPTISLTLSK